MQIISYNEGNVVLQHKRFFSKLTSKTHALIETCDLLLNTYQPIKRVYRTSQAPFTRELEHTPTANYSTILPGGC